MEAGIPNAGPSSAPQLPTMAQLRRLKYFWRSLLISNFALGAYLFTIPKTKKSQEEKSNAANKTSSSPIDTTTSFQEEQPILTPTAESTELQQPLIKDQQRGLFGWLKNLG